ncbi:MAG: 2-phospho-L-lactate transferase [Pseudomonadota bacterium]
MTYLALTGGVGGAKLALGLSKLLGEEELMIAVNTADDFQHFGLHISPDIDTLLYTLAGESNPQTGWGRREESWGVLQALEKIGAPTWFQLGDKDLAVHLERSGRLASGQTLTEVTAALASALGVRHRVLPMSDQSVRTTVHTTRGPMAFQHYFVRARCQPIVQGFSFDGVERAEVNPVIDQCLRSDTLSGVILCPSNPFVSIDPILALPGLRQRLRTCCAPVIAVSPVVGGRAIKGPTVEMMEALSLPNSAVSVAAHYQDFLSGFVLDEQDRALAREVRSLGVASAVAPTVMCSLEDRVGLGRACLDFLQQLHTTPARVAEGA